MIEEATQSQDVAVGANGRLCHATQSWFCLLQMNCVLGDRPVSILSPHPRRIDCVRRADRLSRSTDDLSVDSMLCRERNGCSHHPEWCVFAFLLLISDRLNDRVNPLDYGNC